MLTIYKDQYRAQVDSRKPVDLNGTQFELLMLLAPGAGISVDKVAPVLHIDSSSIPSLISRLRRNLKARSEIIAVRAARGHHAQVMDRVYKLKGPARIV